MTGELKRIGGKTSHRTAQYGGDGNSRNKGQDSEKKGATHAGAKEDVVVEKTEFLKNVRTPQQDRSEGCRLHAPEAQGTR